MYRKKFAHNFARWLTGLLTFVFIAKMSVIYSVPDENTEMLTFMNLKNIYTCLLSEIRFFQKLVSFILHALYRLFGLLKPFLYIVYLIINSLILLNLMEILITRLHLTLQNGIMSESNFETVNVPEDIYKVYNRKALLDNITISDNEDNGTQVSIESCDTDAFREDYLRYTGEDVRMQCGFPLKYHKSQLKIFTSNWLKEKMAKF